MAASMRTRAQSEAVGESSCFGGNEASWNATDSESESGSDSVDSESDSDLDNLVDIAANDLLQNTRSRASSSGSGAANEVGSNDEADSDEDEVSLPFVIDNRPSDPGDDPVVESIKDIESTTVPVHSSSTRQTRHDESIGLSSSLDHGMDVSDIYISFDEDKPKNTMETMQKILLNSKKDELLKKSVVTAGFEKKDSVPPYKESLKQLRKQRQKERESHKGKNWYNMKAPEMTEELKNDLKVMQMRGALDPKRFYKKNDVKGLPKFVQVGTVIEHAADFYHSRIPKKERKKTIVDELLADAEFRRYNKRKYVEIQEAGKFKSGARKHMKRMKRKKK